MDQQHGLAKAVAMMAIVAAAATLLAVFVGSPEPKLKPETRRGGQVSLCGPQIHGGGARAAQG